MDHTKMAPSDFTALSLALLLSVLCVQDVHSITCYQCGTTAKADDCYNNTQGLLNASMGLGDPHNYIKNCTAANPSWDRCMIQSLEQDGVIKFYNRGCHDGKDFGKTGGQFYSDTFKGLNASSNATTCVPVVMLACYTFCDTDLCNGPQPPPKTPDPCANYTYEYDDDNDYRELSEICDATVHRFSLVSIILMVVVAAVVGSDPSLH